MGGDDRPSAECERAAHDGANIARVGQLVEQQQPNRSVIKPCNAVFQIHGLQRPYGGQHALMHRLFTASCRMHLIEAPAFALGDRWELGPPCSGKRVDAPFHVLRCLGSGIERRDPSFRIGERRHDGIAPPQEMPA